MKVRLGFGPDSTSDIFPLIIVLIFLATTTIVALKISLFILPFTTFLLALFARIDLKRSLVGALLSLTFSVIWFYFDAIARMDCGHSCDADTETSLKFTQGVILAVNFLLFLFMLRARQQRKG